MNEQSFELSPIQERTIQLLLAGTTIAAAARELNIDRTTIYAWRKNHPVFSLALHRARKIQTESLEDSLQDLASTAADTLHKLLVSEEVPASIRLRAAIAALNARQQRTAPAANPPQANPTPEQHAAIEALIGPPRSSAQEIRHNSTEFDTFDTVETVETTPPAYSTKIGRNEPCPCASGLKYKRCCGHFDALSSRAQAA